MSTLFDEREADKQIIDSLLKTNRTLWRELEANRSMIKSLQDQTNRRKQPMSKILQDLQGRLYIVHKYEQVTEEIARDLVGIFKEEVSQLEAFLSNTESNPVPDAQPDQSTAQGDQSQAAPSDPSQSVAAPAAPADPNQPPVDPNTQPAPAAPALDANGNPIQAAPAPDPNQAQPQPEQPVMPPLQ